MQTQLTPEYQGSAAGRAAQAIVRKCVHCGFCNATCPTYQLLGDELDGPRGRIYLIKQVLEGNTPTRKTQLHLDRCLSCRNCESTCPSGVEYGQLVDIGRVLVEEKVARPAGEKALRWLLKKGLPSPLFGPALRVGQALRPLLPAALKKKLPPRQNPGRWPSTRRARRVLLLAGCVQPAMLPNINHASARVLDAAGIECLIAPQAGCCGALTFHLNDPNGAKQQMRANIDAWWPHIEQGVQAIVMNASGCGVMVKEYGHQLADDPAYAARAARVSALTQDLSELLPTLVPLLRPKLARAPDADRVLAYHPPCTLQHGQRLRGGVEQHLGELGFTLRLTASEAHLCCGSAGTYSVLNPGLSEQLLQRKLEHLQALEPSEIVSANIGCIMHLQSGTSTPVRHWVELLDDALHG
ncbi:glycolate oxidase subunit GlcF [Hydrogenophaga sp.]|uniref:glycolate oxidase subunit GlcF n=1 Tax=Hydrogenophaga sp. TaxID=1904254 RepID=UPI001990CFE3|nr:glycolate oxidase subunit GlcF [Hydrogenophaga sp.]MBD3892675.1 glycolate oxidase subunit GlcF [Hydrogenophaga sp.]